MAWVVGEEREIIEALCPPQRDKVIQDANNECMISDTRCKKNPNSLTFVRTRSRSLSVRKNISSDTSAFTRLFSLNTCLRTSPSKSVMRMSF